MSYSADPEKMNHDAPEKAKLGLIQMSCGVLNDLADLRFVAAGGFHFHGEILTASP